MMAKKESKAAKPKAEAKASPKAEAKTARKMAEQMAEPVKKAGKAIRDTAEEAMRNTASVNTMVINQAETNAKEAFAAMRAAAEAKSLAEIARIQGKFVKEQGARTAQQVQEVGGLIAQFGRDAISRLRG